MILRNFAFKKDEKMSHFAPLQSGSSRFGGASRGKLNLELTEVGGKESKLWFYLSFCEVFKVNLSDFKRETVKEILEELHFYKDFHEKLKKQMQKEFGLGLQNRNFRKFVMWHFRRFIPIQLFVQKHANSARIKNTTSTEQFQENAPDEQARTGDLTMTIDG